MEVRVAAAARSSVCSADAEAEAAAPKPARRGADGGGLAGDLGRVGGGAEDVDEVDRLGDVEQRGAHRLAPERGPGGVRVDRDHPEAEALQLGGDVVAGFAGMPRG